MNAAAISHSDGRTDGSRMDRWAERRREGDADDDALLVRPTDVRPTDFHSLRGIFQSLNRKERSTAQAPYRADLPTKNKRAMAL